MSLTTRAVSVFCGGSCATAFNNLVDVAVDANGNIVALEKTVIRLINTTSFTTSFVAGKGANGFTDGSGTTAAFNSASAITVDLTTGNYYVADTNNNAIRRVTPAGSVTTVVTSLTLKKPAGIMMEPPATRAPTYAPTTLPSFSPTSVSPSTTSPASK
jgi:hypothetical protein